MSNYDAAARILVLVGDGGVQTDLDLTTLDDSEVADVLPDMLVDYSAECKDWTFLAREHWQCGRVARVDELLQRGIEHFTGGRGRPIDNLALVNIHAMLAHFHLWQSRSAPKTILPHAKYDIIPPDTKTKEHHYTEATGHLNRAEEALRASGTPPEEEPVSVAMGKIMLYLARGQPATAAPLVDRLLQRQPSNLAGLVILARLQFARRQHDAALLTYQKLLQLNPELQPDPRIGLGLCAYVLGDRQRARAAWERSLERDPEAWAPRLLLGLGLLNLAREPSHSIEERLAFESEGVEHVQRAFRHNNKSTAAALALTVVATLGNHIPLASKLAERAIQYSDNKRHLVLANSERGRLGFIAGDIADAGPYIAAAKSEDPTNVNIMAELTLAQIAIKNGNLREALNFVEQTAKRLAGKAPIEFTVLHASLLAYPHLGMPADELARNRLTARGMLADIQGLVTDAKKDEDWAKLRGIATDSDVFIELAKLWQQESIDKAIASYRTAISIKTDLDTDEETKPAGVDYTAVRLSTNLASLYAIDGDVEASESMLQEALQRLAAEDGKEADQLKTVLAYDLGRASEQGGNVVKATQWYRDVLSQHPEHTESKLRLTALAAAAGRNVDANSYLKECLRTDDSNLTVRSAYTNFLISLGSYKEALTFAVNTLKFDKNDAYTFTALGWLHFTLGREAKSPADVAGRPKQYLRSAEAYERALSLDPTNAVAAQGLAIALAEDSLTPKALQPPLGSSEDIKTRSRLAGHALTVLGRIKDSLPTGPVNVNIGHCYFIRGEEERAIEAYEAALNAYGGRRVPVLLYLSRAWYSYANRDSNFSAMGQALHYATRALHIQPSDRAILYNIALIQQKAAEIAISLDPSRRTLDELQLALKRATEAGSIFHALAEDKGPLPYDAELAQNRARYAPSLLKKGQAQVTVQEAYESETAARVGEARRLRAEEQARIEAAAAARQAEIDARAAELAEQRRQAREEALSFQKQLQEQLAEEETRKVAKLEQRKRRKEERDEDGAVDGEDGSRRKKRGGGRKRKARSKSEVTDEGIELEGTPSGGEEEDEGATRKKTLAMLKSKKRKSRHEDPDGDDDGAGAGRRGGKQFKSKAIIEDSDEDMDDDDGANGVGAAPSPGENASSPVRGDDDDDDDDDE